MPERVRPRDHGGETYVIIPFSNEHSAKHLRGKQGRPDPEADPKEREYFGRVKPFKADICVCRGELAVVLESINRNIAQTDNTVIYICGHCEAGSNVLGSSDLIEQITAIDLANMFDPLDRDFRGHFKLYACESAQGKPSSNVQSFTQHFADEMYMTGFKVCRYYGYTADVSTWRYRAAKDEPAHKYSGDSGRQASEFRIEIKPGQKATKVCPCTVA